MSKAGTYSNQGDDYQRAIATSWMIDLLTNNEIEYVQVESNGLSGTKGQVYVDDIVVVYKSGTRKYIQVKKNQTQERSWSIKDWGSELPKILLQLEQGEHITVELYSSTPLGEFTSLPKECRLFPNFCDFKKQLSKKNTEALSILVKEWNRSETEIFNLLKRLRTGSHHNTENWIKTNKERLNLIITYPSLALDTLDAFINKHQSKDLTTKFKLEIRSKDIFEELANKGLTKLPNFSEKEIVEQFQRTSAIGRNDWKRTIAGQKITRKELIDTLNLIRDKKKTILVQDRPGSGKTCLLLDLADAIDNDNKLHLLFIKGDRFAKKYSDDSFLPKEIVESCGLLGSISHVVVVLDSLDVLSCQRDHAALNFFLKLIDQLHIIQNVTVVVACREFDLKYDPRLRDRKWDAEIRLENFDFQNTVLPILHRLDVNVELLNPELKELLCLPQNLSLFEKVSGYSGAFNVRTTYDLHNAFIEFVLKQDSDIENPFFEKIFSIVNKLLKEREHSLPLTIINIDEQILHNLASKGILNEESDGKIGFSHQTLFDSFVACNALQNGITLSRLILTHPPLPFYRPSVRSYLFFSRSQSFKSFSRNVRETLSNNQIAYHFKRLIVETYADMIPTNDDWNLTRWMFLNQNELFKRFFFRLKSSSWFEIIAQKWYPFLTQHPHNYEWYSFFIRKLDVWMNSHPNEIIEIWNKSLTDDWGRDNVWVICHSLTRFQHYHIDGVENLIQILRRWNDKDLHLMGTIYCNYIEATGNGYEFLWNWITRDISVRNLNFGGEKIELHCESHNLKNRDFLNKHLKNSDEFLNLVLRSLMSWSESSFNWKENELIYKLLEHTSIPGSIAHFDSINIKNISILIQSVEEALLNHAKNNSKWWQNEETKLRKCKELGFRYILIKAYMENIENSLDGIASQLLDKELFESDKLNYELGLLINESFHLLPIHTQDKITSVIENLFSEHTQQEKVFKDWHNRVRFELLIRIPACFRAKSVIDFIDKYIPQFDYCLPSRRIYSSGGWVSTPVSAQNLDNVSVEALYNLFCYYKDYKGISFHPADGISGGMEELSRTFHNLAKNNPTKYLDLANNAKFEDFTEPITKSILEGIGSHINNRLGKVSDSTYKPISPLPDINEIARGLLNTLIIKHPSFQNDTIYARTLEKCIAALSSTEDLERVTSLLIPLSMHSDPDGEGLRMRRLNDTEVTASDIVNNSINCTRGVVANAALEVLNKLLDLGVKPVDTIISLIEQMANDRAPEVRAALLFGLAYTSYKCNELGWQIFNIIFNKKQTHLWVLAERFLYYQYHDNFGKVKPCLDRIKNEAINVAGATWGRLSALCMIQGFINQHDLFQELKIINNKDTWNGALSVFIANLEKDPNGLCHESLRAFIKDKKIQKDFGHQIDGAFRLDEKGKFINSMTGKLFINSLTLDDEKTPRTHFFFEWIEYQSTIYPAIALELCESLISKLQSFESKTNLWHTKPLISTLTTILREADEMDDLELINRAIHLQDQFLLMGIDGMEEYFEEAATQ